jgi:acetylornithine deacetylase/succinyl-diaminopimelate desuccinylase-like protein
MLTGWFRSAVELLLESGKFNPARTVILAFGIDEETGGKVVGSPIYLGLDIQC